MQVSLLKTTLILEERIQFLIKPAESHSLFMFFFQILRKRHSAFRVCTKQYSRTLYDINKMYFHNISEIQSSIFEYKVLIKRQDNLELRILFSRF